MLLSRLNRGGMGSQAVFSDQQLEVRVSLTQRGDETRGRVPRAIIFGGAILRENRCGHQRHPGTLVGVDERRTQPLMGGGTRAVSVVVCQTRIAVQRFGGHIARASEGSEVGALNKAPCFKGLAALELTKNRLKRWSQTFGLDRSASLAHRGIARDPPAAVNPRQVVCGPLLIKGEQRGGLE